jgi:CRISPR-associated RAMP protein (TIGR02581 family)
MSFEKLTSRVTIRGRLVASTGLHIGAGSSSIDPSATDSPIIRDARGLPFIPGSSLKGALRAHVESLVRSLSRKGFESCDPLAEPCIPSEKRGARNGIKEMKEGAEKQATTGGELDRALYDDLVTAAIEKGACVVCQLFGSPWLSSRVLIKDSFVEDPSSTGRIDLRDGVGIDRDTETARKGVKYDFEVVPPTTSFKVEVVAENADGDLMGLLALGLREMEQGRVALGGKRTRGLGRIRLIPTEIEVVDNSNLLDYLLKGRGKVITDVQLHKYLEANIRKLGSRLKPGGHDDAQEVAE